MSSLAPVEDITVKPYLKVVKQEGDTRYYLHHAEHTWVMEERDGKMKPRVVFRPVWSTERRGGWRFWEVSDALRWRTLVGAGDAKVIKFNPVLSRQ